MISQKVRRLAFYSSIVVLAGLQMVKILALTGIVNYLANESELLVSILVALLFMPAVTGTSKSPEAESGQLQEGEPEDCN